MAKGETFGVAKLATWAVSAVPWLAAMYTFYWLDSSGTWTSDTPHRGKLSVVLLGGGMLVSFLLHSWFARRSSRGR